MIFKNAIALIGLANIFVVPSVAHSFWLNVDKKTGEIEVTFSEKAGVPDTAIQHLKDKIEEGFTMSAMFFGEDKHFVRKEIEWNLEEARIMGILPKADFEASNMAIAGHLDMGPFNEYGIDVDDLQMLFSSSQLRNKKDKLKVQAHAHMKEKPFYLGLEGCDNEIVATVHGLATSIGAESGKPVEVCFYEIGGKKIGCEDAERDDDAAVARIRTDLNAPTTIFAKTSATFESSGGKGTAKHATISANYEMGCTY